MPVPDFESYKVVNNELSSSTKFDNFVQAVEDEFGDIDRDQLSTQAGRVAVPFYTGDLGAAGSSWDDAVTDTAFFWLPIPDDYVSGDLTWRILRRGAATNTAVMRKTSNRFRPSAAPVVIDSAVNIDFTPGNTNTQSLAATITAANFQVGDVIRMDIQRLGADGGDTMTAAVFLDGVWVEYTGRA